MERLIGIVSTVIEFFAVPPEEDAAFLAVWAAEAPPAATLHRALRADVQPRFASLPSGPPDGVLLLVTFEATDDRFPAAWESVREKFSARQGFVGARLLREAGGRVVAVVHWSSPLMYARTVDQEGDAIAAIGFREPRGARRPRDELVGDPLRDVGRVGRRQSEDDVLEAGVDRLADRVPGACRAGRRRPAGGSSG